MAAMAHTSDIFVVCWPRSFTLLLLLVTCFHCDADSPLQRQADTQSDSLQRQADTQSDSLLQRQADTQSDSPLQRQADTQSDSLQRQADTQSDSLQRQADTQSGSLQRQADTQSDSLLQRQADTQSDSLQRLADTQSDSLQRQADTQSDSLQRQADTQSDSLLQRQADTQSDSLQRQADTQSDSLQRQADTQSDSLQRQADTQSDSPLQRQADTQSDSPLQRQADTQSDSLQRQADTQSWPCGEDLCVCSGFSADCSGRLAHSTYIPQLPDNISHLDLSHNNLSSAFLTPHVFENLTKILRLDLSVNKITWLSRNVFKGMGQLRYLILDHNEDLEVDSLREVLCVPHLRDVDANHCNLPPPPPGLIQNMTTSVKSLQLSSNPHGGSYHLDGFCNLQYLSSLKLDNCDFNDITSSCQLLFTHLNLEGNTLRKFPETCRGGDPIFPFLESLKLAHNRIETLSISKVCLPWLRYLDLSSNYIKLYPAAVFSQPNFPSLQKLLLRNQQSYSHEAKVARIEDNAFSNRYLESLDLGKNHIQFANRDYVSKGAFAKSFHLFDLDLDSNNFTYVDSARFWELFGHFHVLYHLSLASTGIDIIPVGSFPPSLGVLDLHGNAISNIPDGLFNHFPRLLYLFLHNNRIKSISSQTFDPQLQKRLVTLSLAFNPWHCSCDLLWFQRWFETHPDKFLYHGVEVTDYTCSNLPGTALKDFSMAEQACLLPLATSLLLLHTSTALILSLTVLSLTFRYRWHLRLLLYEAFRGRDDLRRRHLRENHFDYDVFVCYSSEDLPWLRQHLLPRLEGERGLRLCVGERDFPVGGHLVDSIVRGVEGSKKVLVLFSQSFAHSQWCQFELSLCLTHVMGLDDALVVLCVDDVVSRDVTSAMRAVLKTTTYIQWREGEGEGQASFWRRVCSALSEVLPPGHNAV